MPGSGPGRSVTDPLSQAVFDARRNLTEQSAILDDLNKSAAATGAAQPIPTPPLPPNAGVQAFPAEPSEFAKDSQALNEGSLGVIPDAAKDIHTLDHWREASASDRTEALLDVTSLIPGGKLLGEAHRAFDGLDALNGATHHLDDLPTPHTHLDTAHVPHPDAGDHSAPGAGVHHAAPDGGSAEPPPAPFRKILILPPKFMVESERCAAISMAVSMDWVVAPVTPQLASSPLSRVMVQGAAVGVTLLSTAPSPTVASSATYLGSGIRVPS